MTTNPRPLIVQSPLRPRLLSDARPYYHAHFRVTVRARVRVRASVRVRVKG